MPSARMLFMIALVIVGAQALEYDFPEPCLEALWPTGIRVSIPDSPGVELFAFHGSVNKPLTFLAAGDMSRDVLAVRDGRWVFEDETVQLKAGDVVYYWLYVQVRGRGFQRTNLYWLIDSFVTKPGAVPIPSASYTVPEALVEPLRPRGLRVSIPDSPGVQLFAFHGNVNKPMYSLDAGSMSKDIVLARDGRWIFEDEDVLLKEGDIIYYWTYVIRNGLGFRKDNQKFVVTGFMNSSENTTVKPSDGKEDTPEKDGSSSPGEGTEVKLPEGLEFKVVVKDGKFQLVPILPDIDRRTLTKRRAASLP